MGTSATSWMAHPPPSLPPIPSGHRLGRMVGPDEDRVVQGRPDAVLGRGGWAEPPRIVEGLLELVGQRPGGAKAPVGAPELHPAEPQNLQQLTADEALPPCFAEIPDPMDDHEAHQVR